ncbi:hypothetical protein PS732_05293 [Pseudomonas fluorescens]|uniref:Uncharacterized protein n=1 Tax=Pseudomonas fluorescens TaxID=294 RepID=A0ABD7VNF5_PSEFL|nr:hypothetical protein PS732_05293 [Pseudomonas fluorescens]
MSGGGENRQGVLQQVAQVERNVVEHQFAGLDFREVENLVDDPEQAVGGLFDGAQIVELARGQFAFLQQVGEAENAVERRADLVAHVGEEFGLDPARLQRLFTRQIEFDVLDLDGFEVLAHVLSGLIDAVLQFFLGVLQGAGHAVDARRQFVQFLTAERWQTGFQVTVLELRDGLFDLAQRPIDGAAHAQREQRRTGEACGDQQQAGKQAAIPAQQHAVVRQLEFNPAEQAVGFFRDQFAGEVAVLAEDRHQVTGRVIAAASLQMRAVAARRLIEHGRASVGQWRAIRREKGHRAHVRLFEGLSGNAFEQFAVAVAHCWRYQWCQLLGDHFAMLEQLGLQVGLLRPGEITTQHQRHQAGRRDL